MLKKLFCLSAVLITGINSTFATPVNYLGGGFGLQNAGKYRELLGNIFSGYGDTIGQNQNYYGGAEIFADIGSIPLSGSRLYRVSYGLGVSFIPGIVLNQKALAYGRIGVKSSWYNHLNRSPIGIQLGLGLQMNLTEKWGMRGEYVYTEYYSHFIPSNNYQVNLGLIYKL